MVFWGEGFFGKGLGVFSGVSFFLVMWLVGIIGRVRCLCLGFGGKGISGRDFWLVGVIGWV